MCWIILIWFKKGGYSNEKHKKLIIASALSMMAASCYAGSFLPNTVQEKSVDINFAAPEHLTVSLDQVPGLIAGDEPTGTAIAKLTVDSTSVKEFGARGGWRDNGQCWHCMENSW